MPLQFHEQEWVRIAFWFLANPWDVYILRPIALR